jgi:hypothetical protein
MDSLFASDHAPKPHAAEAVDEDPDRTPDAYSTNPRPKPVAARSTSDPNRCDQRRGPLSTPLDRA